MKQRSSPRDAVGSELLHDAHSSKLDVWLARLSHISQFGLFALTIGALYFTVIPLYKTAALEENIARRESELNATNTKLEAATIELAKVRFEIYERTRVEVIREIVSSAPQCAGLMEPPNSFGVRTKDHYEKNLLKYDAGRCLWSSFDGSRAKEKLSPVDFAYLKREIETKTGELERMQNQALLDIRSVPERAATDPSSIIADAAAVDDAEKLNRLMPPGFFNEKFKLQNAIESVRSEIYFTFSNAVVNEFLKLKGLDWPDDK
jgi:hypothetical protein